MLTREEAFTIVKSHLKNQNLIGHCLAVEASMGALAKHFNEDENVWKLAGLLHDTDWEETQKDPTQHTLKTVEWIKEKGEENKELTECILTHNYHNNGFREPVSKMELSLYICDELTGFIVAVALVRPEKKLASVTVDSVLKKFKQKAFAAPVDRDQIALCEAKLGIPLNEFVVIILTAMQGIASEIGL